MQDSDNWKVLIYLIMASAAFGFYTNSLLVFFGIGFFGAFLMAMGNAIARIIQETK